MIIKRQRDRRSNACLELPTCPPNRVKTTPKEVEEITLDSPEGHSQTDDMISFGVDDMEHTKRPDHKPIPEDSWSEREHLQETSVQTGYSEAWAKTEF